MSADPEQARPSARWTKLPPSHLNPERMKIGGPKISAPNVSPFSRTGDKRRSAKKVRELTHILRGGNPTGTNNRDPRDPYAPHYGSAKPPAKDYHYPRGPSWRLEAEESMPKGVILNDRRRGGAQTRASARQDGARRPDGWLSPTERLAALRGTYTAKHVLTDYERMYPLDGRAKLVGLNHPERAEPRPRSWWKRASIVPVTPKPEPVHDWPPH